MHEKPHFRLYRFAGILFALCAALLLLLAVLLPPPRNLESTFLLKTRVLPSWYVISWGVKVEHTSEGLRIIPLQPGRPWVGFRIQRARPDPAADPFRPRLTEKLLSRGVLRFCLRGLPDRTGARRDPPRLQILLFEGPQTKAGHPVRVRPWHRLQSSPDPTWHCYAVPLGLFEARPPIRLFAVGFQAVGPLQYPFEVRDVALELFDPRELKKLSLPPPDVACFPAVVELPPELRTAGKPKLENGRFTLKGRVRFLFGTQISYDMRLDLWGFSLKPPEKSGEKWSGYPPSLAWLYETLPDKGQFLRVGFNTCCVTAPPEPFLADFLPMPLEGREAFDPEKLSVLASRLQMPFLVDLTMFRWTLGALRSKAKLPPGALSPEGSHNMPFSLTPAGFKLYERYVRRVLLFFKKRNIPVYAVELFNEPDIPPGAAVHRAAFEEFLRASEPDPEALRARLSLSSSDDPYMQAAKAEPDSTLFLYFAHAKFLRGRFAELTRRLQSTVAEVLGPGVPTSIQLNRYDIVQSTPLVDPEELSKTLPVLAAPTDGGTWTHGRPARKKPLQAIRSPLAPAPLTADLLQALSGGTKPILDHEMYAPGSASALLVQLWTRVLLGYQGVYMFAWSKRAWQWHTEEEGKRVAERYPFCLLNPYAHPPSELAALGRFRRQLAPYEELLLGGGKLNRPLVAFLHSYTNELAHRITLTARRYGREAYAALRYSHIPFVILTERLLAERMGSGARLPHVLVVSGVSIVGSETVSLLRRFVTKGGVLIVLNSPLEETPQGEPAPTASLLGFSFGPEDPSEVTLSGIPAAGLPGPVEGYAFRRIVASDAQPLYRDNRGEVRVALRKCGHGRIYIVAFASEFYSLLRVLKVILEREGVRAPWTLTFSGSGEHATNVLIEARGTGGRAAVLFANQDHYDKDLAFRWVELKGLWTVSLKLGEDEKQWREAGSSRVFEFRLPADSVRMLVFVKHRDREVGK